MSDANPPSSVGVPDWLAQVLVDRPPPAPVENPSAVANGVPEETTASLPQKIGSAVKPILLARLAWDGDLAVEDPVFCQEALEAVFHHLKLALDSSLEVAMATTFLKQQGDFRTRYALNCALVVLILADQFKTSREREYAEVEAALKAPFLLDPPPPSLWLRFAHVFCSATTFAPHKPVLSPPEALKKLLVAHRETFSQRLILQWIQTIGAFPAGSVVVLANQEIGIVKKARGEAGKPIVFSFIHPSGKRFSPPLERDTAEPLFGIKKSLPLESLGFSISMEAIWGNVARGG